MLELRDVSVVFYEGTPFEKKALSHVSCTIEDGDFITILGSNGAGKSTLFHVISGHCPVTSGVILLDGVDITNQKEQVRAKYIARLFQNPEDGTARHLSVEENLALAYSSNKRGLFSMAIHKEDRDFFKARLGSLGMGLEERLRTPVGLLSGGQRQALALVMALLSPPRILLLDEHTAALDPKSAEKVLDVTSDRIAQEQITALMITHNIRDALHRGNRLFILRDGQLILDLKEDEKNKMVPADILNYYEV